MIASIKRPPKLLDQMRQELRTLGYASHRKDIACLTRSAKIPKHPTMRWIFQLFEGIDLLIVQRNDQGLRNMAVFKIQPAQVRISPENFFQS